MQYRMVCSDLDGTLLNNQSEVSEENLQAIEGISKKGVLFVPSTGRSYSEMPEAIRENPVIRYYICSNGAIVFDKAANKTHMTCIERDKLDRIRSILSPYDVHITVRRDGRCYVAEGMTDDDVFDHYQMFPAHRDVLKKYGVIVKEFEEFYHNIEYVDFFTLAFDSEENMRECRDKLEALGDLRIAMIDERAIEVMNVNAGKGNALCYLTEQLGVSLSETICVGDSDNDRSIMEIAGLGLAVSNASDALKKMADEVICSNEEHAITYILDHYFMSV